MIKVDENEPIGELEAKFPYRDVQIKRGVDVNEYYNLEAEIGRGKFGTVYLCREKKTGLPLAAKFVGIQRRQDRKNVEREVEIMRTLQHPRLIQLYDAFETDNTMVVVLELIEGGELFERVIGDDFILTEKASTIFMRQICEGVAFIHKNNIIHLDLKPENILCLTKTGNRIKIIDFGLARHYEPGNKMQVLFGTPEFVAPEVVNFDQISPATDMWSVGVICYVLLSGLSPFMGDTDVETMSNVTLGRYDFDDESFDNISNSAKDFIANLLLNKKEARMTADECLNHEWLRKKIPPPPPELVTTKENLKTFLDNYNNTNVIAENGINNMMIPKSPLSAVELIEASDKQFLNRDDAKCFSKLGNDQILHPVSLPDVLNANPIVNDNEPPPPPSLLPPTVKNVTNTNDEVLNVVNANFYSMLNPPVLDNSSPVTDNSQFVSDLVANVNLIQDPSLNELQNNNVTVAPSPDASTTVKTDPMPPTMVPPVIQKSPSNIIPVPEVPVAPLPFISKSLPAAAVLLDEAFIGNWSLKPLPTPSLVDDSDEPIIAHPPVVGTTLPRKRGSMDVGSLTPKRGSIDVENILQKRGSFEIPSSFLQKRGSADLTPSPLKRLSSDIGNPISRRESLVGGDKMASPIMPTVVSPIPVGQLQSQIVPKAALPVADRDAFPKMEPGISQISSNEANVLQPSGVDNQTLELFADHLAESDTERGLPLRPVDTVPNNLAIAGAPPPTTPKLDSALSPLLNTVDEIFIPQSPVVARAVPITSVQSSPRAEPDLTGPSKILESIETKFPHTVQTPPLGSQPQSPLVFSPELPRTPTSPISPSFFTPARRESPLQKTLDEIPKLSSEILSSLSNITSLSSSSTYESISKKTFETRNNTNSSESNKIGTSRYERVTSPRLMSFTEHKPSSLVGTTPSKTYSTPGSSYSRTKTEGTSSAFASVTSKTYSTSSLATKKLETKEKEVTRQSSRSETFTRTDSKTSSIELDSQGFKPKLRSTAPWFSQKKAENEKTIEQKSTDISALLKENLGPLERSRWAREVRQISAKLVELSKDQSNRKQQEEDHLVEMNKQQTARRQKFKLSILNRDVVLGEAREFYVSGEVPMGAHGISHIKQNSSTTSSTSSKRFSPERSSKPLTRNVAK